MFIFNSGVTTFTVNLYIQYILTQAPVYKGLGKELGAKESKQKENISHVPLFTDT